MDVADVEKLGRFDWVFANFFLNVFSETQMRQVVTTLMNCTREEGRIVVGDFCRPSGSFLRRVAMEAHWLLALLPFALLCKNAIHRVYDYRAELHAVGLEVKCVRRFYRLRVPLYESIEAAHAGETSVSVAPDPQRSSSDRRTALSIPRRHRESPRPCAAKNRGNR